VTEAQLTGLALKLAGDNLYAALPLLQKRVEQAQGAKDLTVTVIVGEVHDQTVFTGPDGAVVMTLTVCLEHPDQIGDVAAATFRACTYALFTIVREQLRHRAVRDGHRRIVPSGCELEASMPVGRASLEMRLQVH